MNNEPSFNYGAGYTDAPKTALPPYEKKIDDTPVTSAQRWLLLGALFIGLLFQQLVFGLFRDPVVTALLYAGFWIDRKSVV